MEPPNPPSFGLRQASFGSHTLGSSDVSLPGERIIGASMMQHQGASRSGSHALSTLPDPPTIGELRAAGQLDPAVIRQINESAQSAEPAGSFPGQSINLRSCGLWDRGARTVGAALEAMPGTTSLDVSLNDIGPAGTVAIAAAIKSSKSLRLLSFDGNPIGNSGCRAIAAAMREGAPALEQVLLARSFTRSQGVAALGQAIRSQGRSSPIRVLDLSGNSIGPSGARALAEGLQEALELAVLRVAGCMLRNQGAAHVMSAATHGCPKMEVLDLRDNFLSDGAMEAAGALLGASGSLKALLLGGQAQAHAHGAEQSGAMVPSSKARGDSTRQLLGGTGRKISEALEASGASGLLRVSHTGAGISSDSL